MSSIDERIVSMKFDNGQFQRGIADSLKSLDDLKKGLNLDGAKASLNGLNDAGKNFSLAGIASGVENVSSKFSALGAIGFSVLQNLTNTALNFGKKILSGVLDPLIQGGKTRALTIEQAKFQFEGLGMDIDATMASARNAVLGTAYSLADAAKAASMFGASGMRAGDGMTSSLRAIAGVAAMTGSSYEDMSNIFTSVAGNGRLMGNDLLQLSSRGINAAATLATAFGKTEAEVREMVTKGEISFQMFSDAMDGAFGQHATDANKTYTGSLANMKSALSRIGADVATASFENQRKIFNALTPVIDKVHTALMPLIDAFTEITGLNTDKLVTMISAINLKGLDLSIPPIVQSFKNIIAAFMGIFTPIKEAFSEIFPPARSDQIASFAFAIQNFTAKLTIGAETAANLKRTFAGVFAIFSIGITIIKAIASMFGNLFSSATEGSGGILDFTGNIGDFLVSVDKALKSGDGLAKVFDKIEAALQVPIAFIRSFGTLLATAFDSIRGIDTGGLEGLGQRLHTSFEPLTKLGEAISVTWRKVGGALKAVWDFFAPMASAMAEGFKNLGSSISNALASMDPEEITGALNTGLFAGGILLVRNFINRISGLFTGQSQFTIISSLRGTFLGLTNSLTQMQNTLKAGTLLMIAAAVALLAASIVALSMIEPAKLASALAGLTVLFTQLFVSMKIFMTLASKGGAGQMVILAGAMILVAIAVDILASAVTKLSELSWSELTKGLVGVTVLLAALAGAAKLMSGNTEGLIGGAAGMVILAVAIKILVSAVADLAELSWEELLKGLVGVTVLLAVLSGAAYLMSLNAGGLITAGIGMIAVAIAVKILASAIGDLAAFTWEELGRGLAGMAGALLIVVGALSLITPSAILSAAGVVIVSAALVIIADVMKKMGSMEWEAIAKSLVALAGSLLIIAGTMILMTEALPGALALIIVAASLVIIADVLKKMGKLSWEEIAKSMVALAGSLLIIAGAMILMTEALPGAAALIIVAASLAILAPILIALGNMSWEEIGKGLAMLAGVFVVLGLAGLLLTPVIPTLLGLAVAIALLGVGVLLAGVGLLAFSVGLTALAAAGAIGVAAIVAIVSALIGLIPMAMVALANGIVAFVQVFADSGPTFVTAMETLITSLCTAVNNTSPLVIQTLVDLINLMLDTLEENLPGWVDQGAALLVSFLDGIAANMEDVITSATNVIVKFIDGIGNNLPRIIDAGVRLVVKFLEGVGRQGQPIADAAFSMIICFINGITTSINEHREAMTSAGKNLAWALINGMTGGLADKVASVAASAKSLASRAVSAIKGVFDSHSPSKETFKLGVYAGQGLAYGLEETSGIVMKASEKVGNMAVSTLKKSMSNVASLVSADMDMIPIIRPVLDLSSIKKDSGLIDGLLMPIALIPGVSYDKAASIAVDTRSIQETMAEDAFGAPTNPGTSISFTQTNSSPAALSEVEIYRQTRNLISIMKGALPK